MPRSSRPSSHDEVASFDHRASTYEHGWRAAFHARVVSRSAEVALETVLAPRTVLDVGCGTGALLRVLAGRLPSSVELVGVDAAPAMIAAARATLREQSNVSLAVGFAESLP